MVLIFSAFFKHHFLRAIFVKFIPHFCALQIYAEFRGKKSVNLLVFSTDGMWKNALFAQFFYYAENLNWVAKILGLWKSKFVVSQVAYTVLNCDKQCSKSFDWFVSDFLHEVFMFLIYCLTNCMYLKYEKTLLKND